MVERLRDRVILGEGEGAGIRAWDDELNEVSQLDKIFAEGIPEGVRHAIGDAACRVEQGVDHTVSDEVCGVQDQVGGDFEELQYGFALGLNRLLLVVILVNEPLELIEVRGDDLEQIKLKGTKSSYSRMCEVVKAKYGPVQARKEIK